MSELRSHILNFCSFDGVGVKTRVILGLGVGVGVASYCMYYFRWVVGVNCERYGRKLIDHADSLNPNLSASATLHQHQPRRTRSEKIASAVARQCRAKFCLDEYSEESYATRRTVHKWMYDKVSNLRDMREADIPMVMEIAMVLVFIPSVNETFMRGAEQASSVRFRKALLAGPWWSGWWKHRPHPRSG